MGVGGGRGTGAEYMNAFTSYQRKIRRLKWEVVSRFLKEVSVQTRHGLLNISCGDEVIGKSLYLYGEYEIDLILEATSFLDDLHGTYVKGKGTILDIGANIGTVSVGM